MDQTDVASPTLGALVEPRSLETSGIERTVYDHLLTVGVPVAQERLGILCRHPGTDAAGRPINGTREVLTITPDIVIPDWRLVIEVDPCGDGGWGATHRGKEDHDRMRNALLSEVGWSTIRLRLSAAEGEHIGDRDVTVESDGFTKAAQVALMAAIEGFRAGEEPCVRHVRKGASPRPAQPRSHVINIRPDHYSDGGYVFSWRPSLASKDKVPLRLAIEGRYLYSDENPGLFIGEVGLDSVPRSDWKAILTAYLADKSPANLGTTKWPWGETLLIGSGSPEAGEVMGRCEHCKHTIDRARFWFSVSGSPFSNWTPTQLLDEEGSVVVTFAPEAIALGYHFEHVEALQGRYGPYVEVFVARTDTASPEDTSTI